MKIDELAATLGYTIVSRQYENREIADGYTSDLMSDVMGNAQEESLLITIQAHRNSVAVAVQLDFAGILICNGRAAPAEMLDAASEHGLAVLTTDENQFVSSYRVYLAIKGAC